MWPLDFKFRPRTAPLGAHVGMRGRGIGGRPLAVDPRRSICRGPRAIWHSDREGHVAKFQERFARYGGVLGAPWGRLGGAERPRGGCSGRVRATERSRACRSPLGVVFRGARRSVGLHMELPLVEGRLGVQPTRHTPAVVSREAYARPPSGEGGAGAVTEGRGDAEAEQWGNREEPLLPSASSPIPPHPAPGWPAVAPDVHLARVPARLLHARLGMGVRACVLRRSPLCVDAFWSGVEKLGALYAELGAGKRACSSPRLSRRRLDASGAEAASGAWGAPPRPLRESRRRAAP